MKKKPDLLPKLPFKESRTTKKKSRMLRPKSPNNSRSYNLPMTKWKMKISKEPLT